MIRIMASISVAGNFTEEQIARVKDILVVATSQSGDFVRVNLNRKGIEKFHVLLSGSVVDRNYPDIPEGA